jgi:DNA-binding PadR family transcriptional regulator
MSPRPAKTAKAAKGELTCPCAMQSLYRFVEPLILWALRKNGTAHGYELLSVVNQHLLTETPIDGPALYRTLRVLEKNGKVTSKWTTQSGGPARRQYSLTPSGIHHLVEWQAVLARLQVSLFRFIGEISAVTSQQQSTLSGGFMKIVFPFDNAKVSGHFGHCENFLFVDVERSSLQVTAKEEKARPESDEGCGFLPKWLAQNKVDAVIALGMGEGMRRNLEKAGISVVFCQAAADPDALAISFAKGLLASDPQANTCSHGPDHVCHTEGDAREHGHTSGHKHHHHS